MYVVETLVQSGFNDFIDGFNENKEIFENIRQFFSNNKKIIEVTNSILNTVCPEEKSIINGRNNNLLSQEKNNVNPIDLLEGRLDSQIENQLNQGMEKKNTSSNLLDFLQPNKNSQSNIGNK